jgi:hypothetical protein
VPTNAYRHRSSLLPSMAPPLPELELPRPCPPSRRPTRMGGPRLLPARPLPPLTRESRPLAPPSSTSLRSRQTPTPSRNRPLHRRRYRQHRIRNCRACIRRQCGSSPRSPTRPPPPLPQFTKTPSLRFHHRSTTKSRNPQPSSHGARCPDLPSQKSSLLRMPVPLDLPIQKHSTPPHNLPPQTHSPS